jgi:mannose/fructose/N-acetylgalactosamine-specific phosphotransferase system component IIC
MIEIISFSIIASIISLDVTAFGQFMISRPIVCAPLFGYMLGDIKSGLWVGMILELLWTRAIQLGAAIPADMTAVSVLSIIWGINAVPDSKSAIVFATIIAIPIGLFFRQTDIWVRSLNVNLMYWVEEEIITGNENSIAQGIYFGLILFFLKALLFYSVFIYIGEILVKNTFVLLPPAAIRGLELAWYLLPIAGFGAVLVNYYGK